MKASRLILLVFTLASLNFFGQSKSVRELALEADIIAVTDEKIVPYYKSQKFNINDHKSFLLVPNVKIEKYIRKKSNHIKEPFLIDNFISNGFYEMIGKPVAPVPIRPNENEPVRKTVLFAKTFSNYTEVLFYCDVEEEKVTELQEFIEWMDQTEKIKNEDKKCRAYIQKYLDQIEYNSFSQDLKFFDNILLPDSDFMLYYGKKVPQAIQLSENQKTQFLSYWKNENWFQSIDDAQIAYSISPKETLNTFKNWFSEMSSYTDEFEENPAQYSDFIRFLLAKRNQLNPDTEILLQVLEDYYSNNLELKRQAFERLIEKIRE